MKHREILAHKSGKIFALVFWACILILCLVFKDEITVQRIISFVPSNPMLAALVMLVLFAAKGISVFIYCGILYAVSGILFPLPVAVLVNILGSVAMTSLPFWIGRKAGAGALGRLTRKYPKLKMLKEAPNRNEIFMSFFTRIIGILPSDPVSMYFGASGMRYSRFLIGSIAGLFPMAVAFTVMGTSIQDVTSPAFIISACVEAGLMILSIILYCVWRRRSEKENN